MWGTPLVRGVLLLGFLTAVTGEATPGVADDSVLPNRSPRPLLGHEPWPGFRPDSWDPADDFPLGPLASEARWSRWQKSRGAEAARKPAPVPAAPARPRAANDGLAKDWAKAWAKDWERARDRALAGDPQGCLQALGKVRPVTMEAQERVRRLAFAAQVAAGNRVAADSLFYLLSWDDGGRTGSRLAAWLAWENRDIPALERALRAGGEPGSGERAAEAWVRWRNEPAEPDENLRDGSRVPRAASGSSADAFLLLAAARSALLDGDGDLARERLHRIDIRTLPEDWVETYQAAEAGALGGGGGVEGADAEEFRVAESAYLAGEDARARELLDDWLGRRLQSPFRGHAYLYRAALHLDAGRFDRAEDDLRGASRHGEGDVIPRAELLSLFVGAAQGRIDKPLRTMNALRAGRLGAQDEAELLFALTRLERLAPKLEKTGLMQLEEAYPDSPWTERARSEAEQSRPAASPPRVGLASPRSRPPSVDPPRDGPWGKVLWGDDHLAQTARLLGSSEAPEAEPPAPLAAIPPPAPGAAGWTGTAGLGAGSRSTALGEAGLAGSVGGVGLRLRAEGVTTQEPGNLPESKRGSVEWGVSGGRDLRWSAVAEAQGRREETFRLGEGVPEGPVSAGWWGGRLDLHDASPGADWTRTQVAVLDGRLLASGRGAWGTTQAWLRTEMRHRAGSGRWEAAAAVGYLGLRQPDAPERNLVFPDLRLVRRFAGGAYVGLRGAYYRNQGLLMPVAGAEARVGDMEFWAATEPSLELTPFRETFVVGGDWNLPDFDLAAQRRDLDLRGGVRWRASGALSLAVRGEWFHAGAFRTWRADDAWWLESAVEATGRRIHARATWLSDSGFRCNIEAQTQVVTAGGGPVPYVPSEMARAQVGYQGGRWYWGGSVLGVRGRRDANAREFGRFLRWDVEAAYRGGGSFEYTLRIENLGNAADRRWPGYPAYGRGVFGGIRAVWGS